jgi:hypothetical protein
MSFAAPFLRLYRAAQLNTAGCQLSAIKKVACSPPQHFLPPKEQPPPSPLALACGWIKALAKRSGTQASANADAGVTESAHWQHCSLASIIFYLYLQNFSKEFRERNFSTSEHINV